MEIIERVMGLGLEPKDLSFLQVTARGILIFIAALVMVRLGDRRFLSKKTAFDAVLGFILASTLARTVNGSAPLFETIGAGFVIVLLHRVMAHLSRRSHVFGMLVKGLDDLVIQDGRVVEKALRKSDFSHGDLMEDLRLNGVETPEQVKRAHIERNGTVSVIKA